MISIEPGRDYAVVTGDVVGSSDLEAPDRKALPGTIEAISASLLQWFGTDKVSPIAIFGGDSWQLLLAEPGSALRAALFMRASLLASPLEVDTRIAIAIGGVDFVPEAGIEQADGEAFRLSGRLLGERLPKSVGLAFDHPRREVATHWNLVCRLIDALIGTNWTANRARAIVGALQGWTRSQTGELWLPPVARQTVDRHLDGAGWDAIEAALTAYKSAL